MQRCSSLLPLTLPLTFLFYPPLALSTSPLSFPSPLLPLPLLIVAGLDQATAWQKRGNLPLLSLSLLIIFPSLLFLMV